MAFSEELAKCQVESLAIAAQVRNQRAELETKLAGAHRQHKAMGVGKLAQELAEARRLKATSEAEKERRIGLVPGCVIPAEGDGFATWLQASKDAAQAAQSASHRVNTEFQTVAARVTSLREKWGEAKEALTNKQAKLLDLAGGISQLLKQHGSLEQREQNLGNANRKIPATCSLVPVLKVEKVCTPLSGRINCSPPRFSPVMAICISAP